MLGRVGAAGSGEWRDVNWILDDKTNFPHDTSQSLSIHFSIIKIYSYCVSLDDTRCNRFLRCVGCFTASGQPQWYFHIESTSWRGICILSPPVIIKKDKWLMLDELMSRAERRRVINLIGKSLYFTESLRPPSTVHRSSERIVQNWTGFPIYCLRTT